MGNGNLFSIDLAPLWPLVAFWLFWICLGLVGVVLGWLLVVAATAWLRADIRLRNAKARILEAEIDGERDVQWTGYTQEQIRAAAFDDDRFKPRL